VFVTFGSTRCLTQVQNLATVFDQKEHTVHTVFPSVIFNFSIFVEEQLFGVSDCSTTDSDAVSTSSVALCRVYVVFEQLQDKTGNVRIK
jgi:hypothetical protein